MAKSFASPRRFLAKRPMLSARRSTRAILVSECSSTPEGPGARRRSGSFLRVGSGEDQHSGDRAAGGYTPGAIYSYFSSKEEVYAALLGSR